MKSPSGYRCSSIDISQTLREARRHLPLQQPQGRNPKVRLPRLEPHHRRRERLRYPAGPARRRHGGHRAHRRLDEQQRRDQHLRRGAGAHAGPLLQALEPVEQGHHLPRVWGQHHRPPGVGRRVPRRPRPPSRTRPPSRRRAPPPAEEGPPCPPARGPFQHVDSAPAPAPAGAGALSSPLRGRAPRGPGAFPATGWPGAPILAACQASTGSSTRWCSTAPSR